MNKNIWIAGAIIVLILAIGTSASRYFPREGVPRDDTEPIAKIPAAKNKYVDVLGGAFSFEYDPSFELAAANTGEVWYGSAWSQNAKGPGYALVAVSTPQDYAPNTNFADARFTVGRSSDPEAIMNCTQPQNGERNAGTAAVSGYPFVRLASADAGAGNFYEVTSYRGLLDGDCYALEYVIHSTNIGAYSPEQDIREFDRAEIEGKMEDIIQSFEFLINSD